MTEDFQVNVSFVITSPDAQAALDGIRFFIDTGVENVLNRAKECIENFRDVKISLKIDDKEINE